MAKRTWRERFRRKYEGDIARRRADAEATLKELKQRAEGKRIELDREEFALEAKCAQTSSRESEA